MSESNDSTEPGLELQAGGGGSAIRMVAMVPYDGRQPPPGASETEALETHAAVTGLWHPAVLLAAQLPEVESVAMPTDPGPGEIRVVPRSARSQLPEDYECRVREAGGALIGASGNRGELVAAVHAEIAARGLAAGDPPGLLSAELESIARDYLALGTAWWMLRELTTAMGHADTLDRDSLQRELAAGARAWRSGDAQASASRLRAAFEILTQARERFYPVDAYLLDLCLMNPLTPAQGLDEVLSAQTQITLIATGKSIEALAQTHPHTLAALVRAVAEGWLDIAGGEYDEAPTSLLPVESLIWRFARGSEVYRRYLDDRSVETFARRRFGLHTFVPQLARRFGFRYALHMGFDAGVFPVPAEAKRMWEGPDGASLETLLRPPLAADRGASGWQLPWRIAATMKNDHVATIPLIHWPRPVAPWYQDLRRSAAYSPVLTRWMTLDDYFENTDRPYESWRPETDSYQTPYLTQAVQAGEPAPVSDFARWRKGRALLESARAASALAKVVERLLRLDPPANAITPGTLMVLEEELETRRNDGTLGELDRTAGRSAQELANALGTRFRAAGGGEGSGYLIINPLAVPRQPGLILPGLDHEIELEPPVRNAQVVREGLAVVVDLPPLGFCWVRDERSLKTRTPQGVSAQERRLANELMAIEIDGQTGGLRGVFKGNEETPRIGQQLVACGPGGKQGGGSKMVAESCTIDHSGPALAQATTRGSIVDNESGRRIALFRQQFRLWGGQARLEIDIEISDLEPAWHDALAQANPWQCYLGCRWAWPNPESMLRRLVRGIPELTEAERPETAEGIDISTRTDRTLILAGGHPFHRRQGPRMLDTILIAGREQARVFRLGLALDDEHPARSVQDFETPPIAVRSNWAPPTIASSGWLILIDSPAITLTRLEYLENIGDEGFGLALHLLETSSSPTRARVRFFSNPRRARQVDFQGEIIIELRIEHDAVLVDLTPGELARIVVVL